MKKPKRRKFRQETIIHSYIVRPLAQELVLLIWNTKITPNQLTLMRSMLSCIYLYLFYLGTNISFIVGIVIFQIAEVMDHADGMLARMKKQTSKLGQYFEYISDELFAAEHGLLSLVIAYGAYRYTSDIVYIYLAVMIMFFCYFAQYIKIVINSNEIISTTEINHDKEEMLKIVHVPPKEALKNIFITIYTWRNQLFFVGLVYLMCYGSFLLFCIFGLFLLLNILKLAKQLRMGYIRNKA